MKHTAIFLSVFSVFTVFSVHAQTNILDQNSAPTIIWSKNGMIGVNNNNPQYTLDVTGFSSSSGVVIRNPVCSACDLVLQNVIPKSDGSGTNVYHLIGMYPGFDPNAIYIGGYNAGEANPFVATAADKVLIGNPYYPGAKFMKIDFSSGGVGIGTTHTSDLTYQLFVEKGIRTRRVVVDQAQWSDYVFHPGYQLLPLDSLAKYVRANYHLPDVPAADSVAKNGLDLGGNQAQLLKKIEELTLYVIQLQQQIEAQNKTMVDFQAEIRTLRKVK